MRMIIQVFNPNGKLVLEKNSTPEHTPSLNVLKLKRGRYTIVKTFGNKSLEQNIIKM